jgi:uncharacterized protein (TIGR00255 family)
MIQSMTAFARTQRQVASGHLCWEIRSVNHRYLDISFRLPESFRFLEAPLRNSLRDLITRGKLECQLKYQDTNSDNQSMLINIGMVNALVDLSTNLAASHNLANDMTVSRVLGWPGIVHANRVDTDELGQQALLLFQDAVKYLSKSRAVEGAALKNHVDGRLQALEQEVIKARALIKDMAGQTRDKLLTRLHVIKSEVPEARIEQEIALLLTRLDVSEELDRLQTHITEVRRSLNNDKVAGRRLDFLCRN